MWIFSMLLSVSVFLFVCVWECACVVLFFFPVSLFGVVEHINNPRIMK